MADGIDIKVTGVKETLANLKQYQVIKTGAVKIALKETGFNIQGDAKRDCPVDTGRLRASLSTNWSGSPLAHGGTGSEAKGDDGVGRPTGPSGLVVVVGTNVKYAAAVEFGGIRALKWGGYRLATSKLYLSKAYHKNQAMLAVRLGKIFKK